MQVRQRHTLILNAPRLHETWLVVPIKQQVAISITNSHGEQISSRCRVVLVVDDASQRPVGCWVDTDAVDSALALYQSIWHPGASYWPLRGIPDRICIPQPLLKMRQNDIERAAYWMMSTLEPLTQANLAHMLKHRHYLTDLIIRLVAVAPLYIERRYGTTQFTQQHAIEALHTWLFSDDTNAGGCFPQHRASLVPAACAREGLLMPGHASPAAGWLLPVVGQCSTGRNSVVYGGISYTSSESNIAPATAVKIRSFPHPYAHMQNTVFLEYPDGCLQAVHASIE